MSMSNSSMGLRPVESIIQMDGPEAADGRVRAAGGVARGMLDEAGNSFLGTIAVPAPQIASEAAWRLEKWELQSVARFLLPQERIRGCCLHRIPGRDQVDVYFTPSKNSAHYGNLITCASVWNCPVCSARISERRRDFLTRAVAAWEARGGKVALASYTFSHRRSDRLNEALGAFLEAQRWMTGHRPYKRLVEAFGIVGAIRALEATWGTHNGWHPHAHVLLFLSSGVDIVELEELLYRVWAAAAQRFGLRMTRERGVKVQAGFGLVANYVSKWGHQPTRRLWGVEDELVKGHSKRAHRVDLPGSGYSPFDLLRWLNDVGESKPAILFRDYAVVFKRRRQITLTPGLAQLLGLVDEANKSDEELADEIREESLLLASIGWEGWRAVRLLKQQGSLLEVARTGDTDSVGVFIRRLVAEIDGRDLYRLSGLSRLNVG